MAIDEASKIWEKTSSVPATARGITRNRQLLSPMTHVLIIGGDAAGMSAASQLRRRAPDFRITVFEKGVHTSYAL